VQRNAGTGYLTWFTKFSANQPRGPNHAHLPLVGPHLLRLCNSRKKNKYRLVFAPAYGMVPGRDVAILNYTTSDAATLPTSTCGRPLLWFDSDWDRYNKPDITAPRGILSTVLAATPPVIAMTGRTQPMRGRDGEEREAVEVELLLSEDQLSHQCWSCGHYETDTDVQSGRMARWLGEGSESLYCCAQVSVTESSELSS
jgi:hypothetical protein